MKKKSQGSIDLHPVTLTSASHESVRSSRPPVSIPSHYNLRFNSMSSSDGGGSGPDSPAGPSGESHSDEWRRTYDRVEALLPRVQELAADRARLEALDRIRHELSEARENALHARLLQVIHRTASLF